MEKTREIAIVGGGVIGLAIAIELKRRGAKVRVISRDGQQAASYAAAGMLAPMAENITNAPMLDLCLKSRWLYPEWTRKLEELSGIDPGYLPCGILAPISEARNQEQLLTPTNQQVWLDRDNLAFYQPGLGENIIGGWWYPEDGQVDNRCLMRSLLVSK